MADMNSLPTELLDVIFACVAALGEDPWGADPRRTLFPLNLAAVCTRWLNILKSCPRYWQRIVIDLADNPAPFLDTITLFKADDTNTPIDVLVFCSMPSIEKGLENLRARVVFENLEPALERCRTVAFRLAYQSSLPSATDILIRNSPLSLTQLHLTCSIYDRNDDELDLNIDDRPPSGSVLLPALCMLSLTGFHFLELCRAGKLVTIQDDLKLSINHFKFRKQSSALNPVQSEGFAMLMKALQEICENSTLHLALSNLALGYRPSTTLSPSCEIYVNHLSFDAVSPDFILAFFACVSLSNSPRLIPFRRSAIPPLNHLAAALPLFSSYVLELVDIPHETPRIAQHTHNNSICNAIEAFSPVRLRVLRCAGFDNSVPDWFLNDRRSKLDTPLLTSITLHDCTAFTAAGLLTLLRTSFYMHKLKYDFAAINELEVCGRGPALSKGDAAWLLGDADEGWHDTRTRWSVERGDVVEPGVVTDFRSHGEEDGLMWDRTTWGVFPVQL